MEIQEILVICLFLIASVYIGRMIYRNIKADKGCGQNCKCGIDLYDIKPINKN